MAIPLSFELDLMDSDATLEKTFDEILEDIEQLQPVDVIASSPHAMYLEYGSGPVKGDANTEGRSDGLSTKEAIRKWAEVRFPTMSKSERERFAYNTYIKIMKKGTTPHPFMRPAVEDVLSSTDLESWVDDGKTTEELGERIATRMKEYLSNGLDGESHIYQWETYNSIKVLKSTDPRALLMGMTADVDSGEDIHSMVDRAFERRI